MNVFEQRRIDREVPPSAHGSRAWVNRERRPEPDGEPVLIDGVRLPVQRGGMRTVADLVARLREDGEL